MTEETGTEMEPLWLAMERKIQEHAASDTGEQVIQKIAGELDTSGYNVSRHGGNMLQLRGAINARVAVGRPLMTDFNGATEALTLESLANTAKATAALTGDLGSTWPALTAPDRRADILKLIEQMKLDLMVSRAQGLEGDKGIRYFMEEGIAPKITMEALGVTEAEIADVKATIAAEQAAIARVKELLEAVEGESEEARARHLLSNEVPHEDIVNLAGIAQDVLDTAKKAMEKEIAEQERKAAEAAAAAEAKKKAEAEGPPLEDIPADEIVEYIESIEEIREFSDQEAEIRTMCEQSNIPKALVDIAISDPDRLEKLKEEAEG